MQAMDDMALLREYATRNSEAAFAELVARRVGFVYSAALRQARDPHLAEEITQAVFVILAQKAGWIRESTVLSGWLHKTTRFTALAQMRAVAKRRQREQEAQMQSELQQTAPDPLWEKLSPLLDEAMARLGEKDRQAILLRFFENKSLAEVGSCLGTNENTAGRRVTRALEKMRRIFLKRGVVSATEVLAGAISAHSVQAAPAYLAASLAAGVVKTSAASGSILVLVKSALKLMAWHNAKAAIVTGAAIVLAAGTTPVLVKAVSSARADAYPDIEGSWETFGSATKFHTNLQFDLHTVLKISKTNGAYRATLDFVELGQSDFPVAKCVYHNGTVRLQFGSGSSFEGTVDPTGTEIRSVFVSWAGRRSDFLWKRTAQPDVCPPPLTESDYAPMGSSALQGFWEGHASVKGIPMRWDLKVSEPSPGVFRAEFDGLDVGIHHIPVTIVYDEPTVRLTLLGRIELEGTMNGSGTEFRGIMPATCPAVPWTFKRGHQKPTGDFSFTTETELQGHWQGILNVKGIKLRLFLHIAQAPDGKFAATVDSPDQGLSGALATAVRYRPPQVRIEWVWMGCSFAGRLERGELSGVLRSDWATAPLVFQRSDVK